MQMNKKQEEFFKRTQTGTGIGKAIGIGNGRENGTEEEEKWD